MWQVPEANWQIGSNFHRTIDNIKTCIWQKFQLLMFNIVKVINISILTQIYLLCGRYQKGHDYYRVGKIITTCHTLEGSVYRWRSCNGLNNYAEFWSVLWVGLEGVDRYSSSLNLASDRQKYYHKRILPKDLWGLRGLIRSVNFLL